MAELDFLPAPLNSRFQTYPNPMSSPGKCAVCGAVDRPVVDFRMDIQFYGAVMFCFECMASAARVIDMVPRSELVAAEESLAQSFEEQINKRDLVAIPRAKYSDLLMAVSGVFDTVLSFGVDSNDLVATEAREEPPSLFDDVTESVFGTDGVVEQKHDAPISKGRNNISKRNGNGNAGFDL